MTESTQIVLPVWITVVMLIIPTIAAIIAIVIAVLKTPTEIRHGGQEINKTKSDYSLNLQTIADNATDESRQLRLDLAQLRKEFTLYENNAEGSVARVTELEKNLGIMQEQLKAAIDDSRCYHSLLLNIVVELKHLTANIERSLSNDDKEDE